MKQTVAPQPHDYLRDFDGKTFVLRLSGKIFEDPEALGKVIEDIKQLREAGIRCILVYGGTPDLDQKIKPLGGKQLNKRTGLRMTPKGAMPLIAAEREAIGRLIQMDFKRHGIEARILSPDVLEVERLLGHEKTGRVLTVNRKKIQAILRSNGLPVIGFTGMDDGEELNVNADAASAAVATAMRADKLILLTDTDGIRVPVNGNGDRRLSFADADQLLMLLGRRKSDSSLVIEGGMLQKVKAALEAVLGGVEQIHIVHFRELLREIITRTGAGTLIEKRQTHRVEKASARDLISIIALHAECSRGASAKTKGHIPYLKPLSRRQFKRLLPRTLTFKHRGVLIGKIHSEPVKGKPKVAKIGGFAVAEDHQGEQQGQLLMEEMLRHLREEGVETAVSITANPKVKRLYQRLGGVRVTFQERQQNLLASARRRYKREAHLAELFKFNLSQLQ